MEGMPSEELEKPWSMDSMQIALLESFNGGADLAKLSPKRRASVLQRVTRTVARDIEKLLLGRAPKMLAERREDQAGFEARNMRRWRKAFDLMETVWVCCEEVGRNFNQSFRPQAVQSGDYLFEAMTAIHARSMLIGQEIICLLRGGFPDAALVRWRTLHEFTVVATLLEQEGQELALRYLAHADVQATMNLDPTDYADDERARASKERADYGLSLFGDELQRHYGWACKLVGKKRPTFEDLEKKAQKSEGRPIYQLASQHVHSNHRHYDQLLAMSESRETLLLVGPSNSGMVGPLTLASLSLVEITALYINTQPNFDRAVLTSVLLRIALRMEALASRLEKRTAKAAEKRREIKEASAS